MSWISKSIIFLSLLAVNGWAQTKPPHVAYVFPAGGGRGQSVDVMVGGQFIQNVQSAVISGDGIKVELIDKLPIGEMQKKIGAKAQKNAQMEEVARFKIQIDANATTGERELRLITPLGITNKLSFYISPFVERNETEPNDTRERAQALEGTMPYVINGQIFPGDVDHFKISVKKGQHLVIRMAARSLIPYLADAVPGWFQSMVTLYDAKGKELAVSEDARFDPDPFLIVKVPEDADYYLEIRDSIYRGREDFVYRLTVGELPFITKHFPLGCSRGKSKQVRLDGANLPSVYHDLLAEEKSAFQIPLAVVAGGVSSNSIPFAVGDIPELDETEPNDFANPASVTSFPVVINGAIQQAGDVDCFQIRAKQGETIIAEVQARRLGSPLDSKLTIYNSRGEKVAENDDWEDRREGLMTHHADSRITFTVPEDGIYKIQLVDIQGKGGWEYGYRLYIGPMTPDFDLRVVPSGMYIPRGGSAQVTVFTLRRDNFKGAIQVEMADPISGVSLEGGVIPEGVDQMRMTFSANTQATSELKTIRLRGKAMINGVEKMRLAVPADDTMQAFIYRHLVTARDEMAIVGEPAPIEFSLDMPAGTRFDLSSKKELSIPIKIMRRPEMIEQINIQWDTAPKGVYLAKGSIPADKSEGVIIIRANKGAAEGLDNLILKISTNLTKEVAPAGADPNQQKKIKKEFISVRLPAIPIRIVKAE